MTEDEGENFANTYDVKYFEASAQSGTNVEKIFKTALDQVCKNLKENAYAAIPKLEKVGIQEIK